MATKTSGSGQRQGGKPAASAGASTSGPILNGPYDEPLYHYATAPDGNLDYRDRRPGRRIFAPDTPQVPLGQSLQDQAGLYDLNDFAPNYRDYLVNLLRSQLGEWRAQGYPGVTSRVTRDLLAYWFQNPQRPDHQRLFFAQREAALNLMVKDVEAVRAQQPEHWPGQNLLGFALMDVRRSLRAG